MGEFMVASDSPTTYIPTQQTHLQNLLSLDAVRRDTKRQHELFQKARAVESRYALQLRRIASHCGHIIRAFPAGDPKALPEMTELLRRYSEILDPWARHTAQRILQEVARRDEYAWTKNTRLISRALAEEVRSADIGDLFKKLQQEQVVLIKSIPLEAAERVHKFTQEALIDGTRASSLVDEIMRSGHVARSRADLIAVTEVSRAHTSFTEARARHIGSPGYWWETARDARVRKEHRSLQGKFVSWDHPPVAGTDGMRYHAGAGPRCRCWCRPAFNDDTD